MEYVTMQKNSKKYSFSKGDRFPVKRTVMGECVVIRPQPAMNITLSEKTLSGYGVIKGIPCIG